MLYLHGIKIVLIKPFFKLQFPAVTLKNNQYYNIKWICFTWLCFLYQNYVLSLKELVQLCNTTAMTARRSFDVAGKTAFVFWRHGQRRNGTMPTMRVASLCLLSHRSAWIPRARSPSRIKRSRTRLPVGVRSLMCENCSPQVGASLHLFDEHCEFPLLPIIPKTQNKQENCTLTTLCLRLLMTIPLVYYLLSISLPTVEPVPLISPRIDTFWNTLQMMLHCDVRFAYFFRHNQICITDEFLLLLLLVVALHQVIFSARSPVLCYR